MFEIKSVCFDVVMCNIVHDVRDIHGLPASETRIMSDARATGNCSFPGITHISGKISSCYANINH